MRLESIRNPDGIWINTECFREEGNHFMKHGYYTSDPWGSPAWFDYWTEQRRRCIEGYSVGGSKITGDHYFYLNFSPIQKVGDTAGNKSRKIRCFPDFWDGDYNYYWVREIARLGILDAVEEDSARKEKIIKLDSIQQATELKSLFESLHLEVKIEVDYLKGGWNLIVGKSRRKGYTYKNASTAAKNFFTIPYSYSALAAYDKKFLYPKGLFSYANDVINFVNANTGWVMPSDVINRTGQGHIKASYIEYRNGIQIESGFMSEIQSFTFKDNADALRGKDAYDIWFEESGAFGTPGLLKNSYFASMDCVMAGNIKTGMITIFGTSGDMKGGTADYADMFSRPEAFGLLPFNNIWDEDSEKIKVGFFHPFNWNTEGFYDKQGNSDKDGAKKIELDERKRLIKNGATSSELQKRMQERPLGPAEAFGAVSINNFPVVELKAQLQKVKGNKWQDTKGTPVELSYNGKDISMRPILDGSIEPITSYYHIPTNKRGCPIIYESPIIDAPKGLYKIGYDTVSQEAGTSLAAMIVYKGVHKGSLYHDIIVAEYVGRFEDPDDIDRMAEMFAILYNTTVMFENNTGGTKNYFRRIKRLDLLALQPDKVISKNVKNSKVARVYGCHINTQLKDAGERYIKSWLLTVLDYDEFDNPIRVIDRIYSIRLLEELIAYYRDGNFDLISALIMCLIQVQEEELGKIYNEKIENKTAKELVKMIDNMYKK